MKETLRERVRRAVQREPGRTTAEVAEAVGVDAHRARHALQAEARGGRLRVREGHDKRLGRAIWCWFPERRAKRSDLLLAVMVPRESYTTIELAKLLGLTVVQVDLACRAAVAAGALTRRSTGTLAIGAPRYTYTLVEAAA